MSEDLVQDVSQSSGLFLRRLYSMSLVIRFIQAQVPRQHTGKYSHSSQDRTHKPHPPNAPGTHLSVEIRQFFRKPSNEFRRLRRPASVQHIALRKRAVRDRGRHIAIPHVLNHRAANRHPERLPQARGEADQRRGHARVVLPGLARLHGDQPAREQGAAADGVEDLETNLLAEGGAGGERGHPRDAGGEEDHGGHVEVFEV